MRNDNRAVFPGTFDPFTLGHLELVKKAAGIFGGVVVAVAKDGGKNCVLSLNERAALARAACADIKNVTVAEFSGMLTDFCKENSIRHIVRGLRNAADFGFESDLAAVYKSQLPDIETVYFISDPALKHVSSGFVREIIGAGGNPAAYLPQTILKEVLNKYRRKN